MFSFFKNQIFPGISADYSNKIISNIYENQQSKKVDITEIETPQEKEEYLSRLKAEMDIQIERKNKLEDKAKSLLFIITLAITTITFSLNYLKDNTDEITPLIFIFFSITHFIFGGIRALQSTNIKKFNINQITIDFKNDKFILKKEKDTSSLLTDLVISKSLNDLINTKISNLTFASFVLIRNGLILFALFFTSTLYFSFKGNNVRVEKKLDIEKHYNKIDSLKRKTPEIYEIRKQK